VEEEESEAEEESGAEERSLTTGMPGARRAIGGPMVMYFLEK
jgi:hypothetical protein